MFLYTHGIVVSAPISVFIDLFIISYGLVTFIKLSILSLLVVN